MCDRKCKSCRDSSKISFQAHHLVIDSNHNHIDHPYFSTDLLCPRPQDSGPQNENQWILGHSSSDHGDFGWIQNSDLSCSQSCFCQSFALFLHLFLLPDCLCLPVFIENCTFKSDPGQYSWQPGGKYLKPMGKEAIIIGYFWLNRI